MLSMVITLYDKDVSFLEGLSRDLAEIPEIPDEIIVVGTGITEDQLSPIGILAKRTSIIKTVISKRQNQSVARNIGLKISTNKYTCFFDVDDRPHPLKFAISRKVLQVNTEIDYLLHDHCPPLSPHFNFDPAAIRLHNRLLEDPTGYGLVSAYGGAIHHGHITVATEKIKQLQLAYIEHAGGKGREDCLFARALHRKGLLGMHVNAPLVSYVPSNERN